MELHVALASNYRSYHVKFNCEIKFYFSVL